MIRKLAGEIELVCDACGNESPSFDDDEFNEMISACKADGWSVTRRDGHWHHECPSCRTEESALEAARRKFGIR